MRRWDGLVEKYLSGLRTRGLAEGTIQGRCRELDRWGVWLKHRRPRPDLEQVGSDEVVAYIQGRAAFRSKATVAGIVTALRSLGEFLVQDEIRASNPLRWMRGPKMGPRAGAAAHRRRGDDQALGDSRGGPAGVSAAPVGGPAGGAVRHRAAAG